MRHSHLAHRPAVAHRQGTLRSPLAELEQAFLALAHDVEPLTFPSHLVCDEPDRAAWPVDRVRIHLAHPSTRAELRERTWCEVVRRSHELGEPWGLVAVAMTVPVLRRMLARLARPVHLERAEVEQEALAAVATALRTVDPGAQRLDRELFSAADRAVHRLTYAARRSSTREIGSTAVPLDQLCVAQEMDGYEPMDELTVLARAVQAHVVDVETARLIARSRLEDEPMSRLAAERGVSVRQMYRHRTAAEQHLAAHLRMRAAEN